MLWSIKLNYQFLLCALVSVITIGLAINAAFGRFLRMAYNVHQAVNGAVQRLHAFSMEELFKQLNVQPIKVIADVAKTAHEIYNVIIVPLACKAGRAVYDYWCSLLLEDLRAGP
jgi:uncharacterized protein YllA (UPF0747 family)